MGFRFRDFKVYREIRELVRDIYKISRRFPKNESFGLTSQIRRAATSVLLNFAEGSGKKSDDEFNRYLLISIGSIHEIVAILDIALDLGYISSSKYETYIEKCEILVKKLYGFCRILKKDKS